MAYIYTHTSCSNTLSTPVAGAQAIHPSSYHTTSPKWGFAGTGTHTDTGAVPGYFRLSSVEAQGPCPRGSTPGTAHTGAVPGRTRAAGSQTNSADEVTPDEMRRGRTNSVARPTGRPMPTDSASRVLPLLLRRKRRGGVCFLRLWSARQVARLAHGRAEHTKKICDAGSALSRISRQPSKSFFCERSVQGLSCLRRKKEGRAEGGTRR